MNTRLMMQLNQSVIASEMQQSNKLEDKLETVLFLPEKEGRIVEGGLRTQGHFKNSYDNKPLVSIITVVFNSEKYLEETILSVLRQAYDNIEYIIIDGGSTDGTIDIIKKYEDEIDYWVSKADNGIYDAMNKGVDLVTGDWVNFVNSSDILNRNAYALVLDYLVKNSHKCDVIAFGYSIINNRGSLSKVDIMPNLNKKWKMPSSHNSLVYKSNVLREYKFNLNFKYASDFDQINKINNTGKVCKNNFILSNQRDDGVIGNNKLQSFLEYFQICWDSANKMYALYWLLRSMLEYLFVNIGKINEK